MLGPQLLAGRAFQHLLRFARLRKRLRILPPEQGYLSGAGFITYSQGEYDWRMAGASSLIGCPETYQRGFSPTTEKAFFIAALTVILFRPDGLSPCTLFKGASHTYLMLWKNAKPVCLMSRHWLVLVLNESWRQDPAF